MTQANSEHTLVPPAQTMPDPKWEGDVDQATYKAGWNDCRAAILALLQEKAIVAYDLSPVPLLRRLVHAGTVQTPDSQKVGERLMADGWVGIGEQEKAEFLSALGCYLTDPELSTYSTAPVSGVVFWYRPRSDGGYDGPIHNDLIEDVRKDCGGWVPLVPLKQSDNRV